MIFESILCYYIRCWLGLLLFLSSQNTLNLSKTGNFFLGLMNKLKSGETFPFPLSHLSFFWFLLFLCLIDFPSISYLSLCLSQQAKIVFVFIPATWEKSQRFHFQCQISEEGIPEKLITCGPETGVCFCHSHLCESTTRQFMKRDPLQVFSTYLHFLLLELVVLFVNFFHFPMFRVFLCFFFFFATNLSYEKHVNLFWKKKETLFFQFMSVTVQCRK